MRKIIQVIMTPNGALYALCDDGTVWYHSIKSRWTQVDTAAVVG